MIDLQKREQLRLRVFQELEQVMGHIALSERLDGPDAKEQLRHAHKAQRDALLLDATEFILRNEPRLIREFADGDEVVPEAIDPFVIPVHTPQEADLFRYASLQWSVPVSSGYGRRTRFLVRDRHNGKLIAIFALGDPVISQSARDSVIGWTTQQRNQRLYSVYDAFVLGAVEPYRQLLGGKLAALMTLSNEVRSVLVRKYEGNQTAIAGQQKDPTPALITTTSALGRSSIYNRLTFEGTRMFHSVGFTKGYGHFHFSDDLFAELRSYVNEVAEADPDQSGRVQANRYGNGPNWKFRVIRNALQLLEVPASLLQHNLKREVFLAPVASNWDAYLRGETNELHCLDMPAERIGKYYRERWAVARSARVPGYKTWHREDGLLVRQLELRARQMTFGESERSNAGKVVMRPYLVRVGTREEDVRGETIGRSVQSGRAYFSDLVGPLIALTVADIQWDNGEREIKGWSRHESDDLFEQVVDRLRIGIYQSPIFKDIAVMDLRIPGAIRDGARATVRRATTSELDILLGFDVARALDEFGEATMGTRAELLRDAGKRRNDLCVAFPSANLALPAVVWALVRPLALGIKNGLDMAQPTAPVVTITPPKRSVKSV
jgi:hypothetical protein